MNRLLAFFLFIAYAAFFVEAVKIPAYCQKQAAIKCSMDLNKDCKMMAGMTKKEKPAKGENSCNSCIDCPFCAVTTFRGIIQFISEKPLQSTEYLVMVNSKLSDYHNQQWKPPNC